jgi:hypothetical protein
MKTDDQLARVREIVALIEDPMSYTPVVKIDVRHAYAYLGQAPGKAGGATNINNASQDGNYRTKTVH